MHLEQEPGPRAEDPMGQPHVPVDAPKRCGSAQHTSPSPGLTRAAEGTGDAQAERTPDVPSLLTRSHEPGACSCFTAPSQTQTVCLILKAFIKADAHPALSGTGSCAARSQAELHNLESWLILGSVPHPPAHRDGRGTGPVSSLSFVQPATSTLQFMLGQPHILYPPAMA